MSETHGRDDMKLTDEERVIVDDIARHWSCIIDSVGDAWARALEYVAARRKALGEAEPPGTATDAGVGAPRGVVSDEVVAWYVECPEWPPRAMEYESDAIRLANSTTNEVWITPLVRQGSPRGVVVTEAQYWAIKRAASILRRLGYHEFDPDPWPGVEARSLDDLLNAIDATKEGGA